jgi:hypothetical protein
MKRYSFSTRRRGWLAVTQLEGRDNPAPFQAFGAAAGGLPLVDVTGPDGASIARFAAYDAANFRGGVRAAVAELDGNANTLEVITGAGPGGGPHVKVFRIDPANGNAVSELASFFAFEPGFTGGVRVAAGNVGGTDARQEIIVAADAGGGPRVRAFGLTGSTVAPITGPMADFFAFEPGFLGGVRVSAGDLNGNPADGDELLIAAGPGGGPRVRVLRSDGAELSNFFAFRQDFLGGANVSVDDTTGLDRLRVDALTDDVSQRSAALNTAAGIVLDPSPTPSVINDQVTTGISTGLLTTGPTGVLGIGPSGAFSTGTSPVFSTGGVPGMTGFGTTFGQSGFGTAFGTGFGSTAFGVSPSVFTTGLLDPFSTLGNGAIGPSFGSFGTGGAVGVTGTATGFGPFGDPGPLVVFPELLSPPFTGTFTGIGTRIVTTDGLFPVGG